jgi:hypothetical protein
VLQAATRCVCIRKVLAETANLRTLRYYAVTLRICPRFYLLFVVSVFVPSHPAAGLFRSRDPSVSQGLAHQLPACRVVPSDRVCRLAKVSISFRSITCNSRLILDRTRAEWASCGADVKDVGCPVLGMLLNKLLSAFDLKILLTSGEVVC